MEQTHDKAELLDFSILVLSTASWPLQPPTSPFNIPAELLKTYERFSKHYESKHSGRKLNWLYQLCKGEVKTSYLSGKTGYTFQVSVYQMAILLQYNQGTSYEWEELVGVTGLTPEVLVGQLGNLVKAKVLLVTQGSLGKPKSRYDLNMDFKSKKIRINLNMAVKAEQKAEAEETHKTVEEDRKLVIQVCLCFFKSAESRHANNACCNLDRPPLSAL
jgi:cullin 1